jgi:O-antigen ligase
MVLEHDVTPKLVLLLCATAAFLLCGSSWRPGVRALLTERNGRLFLGVIFVGLLSLTASTALSNQPQLSFAGSAWRRFGWVTQSAVAIFSLLCAAQAIAHRQSVKTMMAAVSVCGGVLSVYAIAQYAGWDPLLSPRLYTIEYYNSIVRVPATLGHALYLGSFLAASFPLMLGLAAESHGRRRQAYWVGAALAVIAIVLSGSRSALLALSSGAVLYLATTGRMRLRQLAVAGAICSVFGLALAILLNTGAGAPLRHRIAQIKEDAYGGPRLLVWREALTMIGDHAARGFGPEVFPNEFRQRQSWELSRLYPDSLHESPHNIVVETAFAQGLPGIAVIAGLIYLLFSVRSKAGTGHLTDLRASAAAMFVSLLFIPVTISGALLLWTTVALMVAEGCEPGAAGRRASGKPRMQAMLVGPALLLCAAAAAYLVKDRGFAEINDALTARSYERANAAYLSAAGMWFPAPGDDLWASRQFATAALSLSAEKARGARAAAAAARARAELTSDTRADAAYQSALLAFGSNDAAAGERKLRDAVRAAPNWYKPHLLLAQLYQATGREAEQDTELRLTLELAGPLRAEVEKQVNFAASEAR